MPAALALAYSFDMAKRPPSAPSETAADPVAERWERGRTKRRAAISDPQATYAAERAAGASPKHAAIAAGYAAKDAAWLEKAEPVAQVLDQHAMEASERAVGTRTEVLNRLRDIWLLRPEAGPVEGKLTTGDVIRAATEWARMMGFGQGEGAGDERDPATLPPDELEARIEREAEALMHARDSIRRAREAGGEDGEQ